MDIYREELLEHYKHPQNFGELAKPTHHSRESNPLCGDVVGVDLLVENGFVKDVAFSGQGCAISVAASSMFLEKVKGMKVEEVKAIKKDDVINMVNPNLTLSRIKCATLGYNAVLKMLG